MAELPPIEIIASGFDEAGRAAEKLEKANKASQAGQRIRERIAEKEKQERKDAMKGFTESERAQALSGNLQKFTSNQFVSNIGAGIADPNATFSGSGIGQGMMQGAAGLALNSTVGRAGPIGAVIAEAMSGALNLFTDRFFARQREIENAAGSATRGRVEEFASRGVGVADSDIAAFLNLQRKAAGRVQDAFKQVARVQDKTSGSVEGMIGGFFRRTFDAIGL